VARSSSRFHRQRQVGVGAAVEPPHAIPAVPERGGDLEHADARGPRLVLDLAADFEAVDVGEVDVEDHEGRLFLGEGQRLLTGPRLFHHETVAAEEGSHQLAPVLKVVDDDDADRWLGCRHGVSRS